MDQYLIWGLIVIGGLFIVLQFKPAPPPFQSKQIKGVVRYVVDGDSLYLSRYKPQVRLWGVDAPEKGQSGFNAATEQLKRLADGKKITCKVIDHDRYGRTVARCFLSDGQEINAAMIGSGTAKEYRRFTKGFYSR